MSFWKAMALGGYLLGWFERAGTDGKITIEELGELVMYLAEQFDLPVEIELPINPKFKAGQEGPGFG